MAKNKNSKVPVIIAVVIILVVLISGYFRVKNLSTQPSTSQTTIDTTNWKTYTNTSYGYSIKVPDYLAQHYIPISKSMSYNINSFDFSKRDISLLDSAYQKMGFEDAITFSIIVFNDDVQENYNLHCTGTALSYNQIDPTISHTSPVNGAEQYVQSYGSVVNSRAPQLKFWASKSCFINNGVEYEINYANYEQSTIDPLSDQILSTFKFTK